MGKPQQLQNEMPWESPLRVVSNVGSTDGVQMYASLLSIQSDPNDSTVNESICRCLPTLLQTIQSDIVSDNEEIVSLALKSLGYITHHPTFLAAISDERASAILLSLSELVISTDRKVLCNLGIWCLGIQQFGTQLLEQHLDTVMHAIVHAIDNPMGSMAVTFEALQALVKLTPKVATKMRAVSTLWAPAVYRRLIAADRKEREIAERCLKEVESTLLPPLPGVTKIVALDIQQKLLPRMEKMVRSQGLIVPAVRAWGWFVRLLGKQAGDDRILVNQMLKIAEVTFISNDSQVRIASLVTWEALIDVLVCNSGESGIEQSGTEQDTLAVREAGFCNPQSPSGNFLKPSGHPSLKRLKLLMMPLISTMNNERDSSVQNACWRTWVYLAHRLGLWINNPSVLVAVVAPVFETIFKSGPQNGDPWVWDLCLNALENFVSSKFRDKSDLTSFAHSLQLSSLDGSAPSPKTPTCKRSVKESGIEDSSHLPIQWAPWCLDQLDLILKFVETLWKCGLEDLSSSTNGSLSLNGASRIWWLVVKGVESDGKGAIKPSSQHIDSVHSLLRFVSNICYRNNALKLPACSKGIALAAWSIIDILIVELRPLILSSSFYKIPVFLVSNEGKGDDSGNVTCTLKGPGDKQIDTGSMKLGDPVTPIVHLAASWLWLIQTISVDVVEEGKVLKGVEKLGMTACAGLDIMGNLQGVACVLDWLGFVTLHGREKNSEANKSVDVSNGKISSDFALSVKNLGLMLKRGFWLLLWTWKMFAEFLTRYLENANDVPAVGGGLGDSGYQVVYCFLNSPLQYYFQITSCDDEHDPLKASKDVKDNNIQVLRGELEFVNATWVKLYDCTSRISSLKSTQPNTFAGGLCQRVLKFLERQGQQIQCCLQISGTNLWKFELALDFLGIVIVNILKQTEISSLAILAINRKRRLGNFMGISVLTHSTFGGDTDDSSNIKDIVSLASRFLSLVWEGYCADKSEKKLTLDPTSRVLGALAGFVIRLYSQSDLLLFMQALLKPLAIWLGSGKNMFLKFQLRDLSNTLLHHLERLWDRLLSCLQKCQPPVTFDSNLLALQAPLLAPALQHFHDPIANCTLNFWEMTYGAKSSFLNYPSCLVPVLHELQQKVRISLPGWDMVSSKVVGEQSQLEETLGSAFLHTYVAGRRRRQMLQIQEEMQGASYEASSRVPFGNTQNAYDNSEQHLELGVPLSPTGMINKEQTAGCSTSAPDVKVEAQSVLAGTGRILTLKRDIAPVINRKKRRRRIESRTCTIVDTSTDGNKEVLIDSIRNEVPNSVKEDGIALCKGDAAASLLRVRASKTMLQKVVPGSSFRIPLNSGVLIRRKKLKFIDDENVEYVPIGLGQTKEGSWSELQKEANSSLRGLLEVESTSGRIVQKMGDGVKFSTSQVILKSTEHQELAQERCCQMSKAKGSRQDLKQGENLRVGELLQEEIGQEKIGQRSSLPGFCEENCYKGKMRSDGKCEGGKIAEIGKEIPTLTSSRLSNSDASKVPVQFEKELGVSEMVEYYKINAAGKQRFVKKMNHENMVRAKRFSQARKNWSCLQKVLKGEVKKLGIQQRRFLRSSGCLRGGKDWRIMSEAARGLPKKLTRHKRSRLGDAILDANALSVRDEEKHSAASNANGGFVGDVFDHQLNPSRDRGIQSCNRDSPIKVGKPAQSPFRVQTLNRGFLARIFIKEADLNKQVASGDIATGTKAIGSEQRVRHHHRKSRFPRKVPLFEEGCRERIVNAQHQESGVKEAFGPAVLERRAVFGKRWKEAEKQPLSQQGIGNLKSITPLKKLKTGRQLKDFHERGFASGAERDAPEEQIIPSNHSHGLQSCENARHTDSSYLLDMQDNNKHGKVDIFPLVVRGEELQADLIEENGSQLLAGETQQCGDTQPSGDVEANGVDAHHIEDFSLLEGETQICGDSQLCEFDETCQVKACLNGGVCRIESLNSLEGCDVETELSKIIGKGWTSCDVLAALASSSSWDDLKMDDLAKAEKHLAVLTGKIVKIKDRWTSALT